MLRWFRRPKPRISNELWQRLLADFPFLGWRSPDDQIALRDLINEFLARKQFSGAHGLMIDDYMGTAIAAQACLPVLHLGLDWYDDFEQIIVYPDQFRVQTTEADEDGVVHELDSYLAGQSIDNGPVVLSWTDAGPGGPNEDYNVVIHEFVHKLDLRDGVADGIPPLPATRRSRWSIAMSQAFEQFTQMCSDAESAMPQHIDPDGPAAWEYFEHLPLDPYAAQSPAEFFAVCGEILFTDPEHLLVEFPAFARELVTFFRFPPPADR